MRWGPFRKSQKYPSDLAEPGESDICIIVFPPLSIPQNLMGIGEGKNRLKMAVLKQGKEARTHYQIEERFSQNTLLRVQLETGRTHQIRVHLSYQGFPIVGDKLYGKTKAPGQGPLTNALNTFPRQALHATTLNFIHPISKKPLTFHANIPDDFAILIENLKAN